MESRYRTELAHKVAVRVVTLLESDILERNGLRQLWAAMPADIREGEIKPRWEELVEAQVNADIMTWLIGPEAPRR